MTTESEYSHHLLISSLDPSFDAFYGIYVESMPLRERKPRTLISAMTTRSDYRFLLLRKNTTVIGFSILFTPPEESFCLLEYMAVHRSYRNQGLGGELFRRSFEEVASRCPAVCGLLEVDSDREQSPDQALRTRRLQFYRRLGCLRVDQLSYLLPLPGEGPPPQMDLLVYFPSGRPPITRDQFRAWLQLIYTKVYACASDDPRIAQMVQAVSDPLELV